MGGFDGAGNFIRYYSWTLDAANGVPITASRFDTEHNGFATGLSNCITRDGQGKPTADIDWNAHKIKNLADPSLPQDAVTLAFLNGTSGLLQIQGSQVVGTGTLLNTVVKYPQTPAELAASVTPVNYAYLPGDARRYGVVGDGVTDDTAALTNMFKAAGNRGVVNIPAALNCLIGQIHISDQDLTVFADGAIFTLSGNNAGFLVDGTVGYFRVYGGTIVGDGVNRDSNSALAQIGWCFGNSAGANVSNAKLYGVVVETANVGFKFANGPSGGDKTTLCHCIGCHVKGSVGHVGGVGYGFQFSQADGSGLVGCTADSCERHGIYFAEGSGYTASDCLVQNCGFGSVRGGIVISRSANVAVSALVSINNNDVGMMLDTDSQGLPPDNVANGVTVTGYTAYGNLLGDIQVGSSNNPAVDGLPNNISVIGASLRPPSGSTNSCIRVNQANGLVMRGIQIDASGAGTAQRAVALTGLGGAQYTTDVSIELSRVKTTGTGFGIQVDSSIGAGTSLIRLEVKQLSGGGSEYDFVGGEDAVTNTSLWYRRSNGHSERIYSGSGSGLTLPAGGVDCITFAPSGATTVSNFSGGNEGDVLLLFFTDTQTTILHAAITLSSSADFVSSANSTLSLTYRNSAWRQTGKSTP